jgi:hypothetical protein
MALKQQKLYRVIQTVSRQGLSGEHTLTFGNGGVEALTMSDKTFRQFASTFHAAEAVHPFMKWVERCLRLLAGVS